MVIVILLIAEPWILLLLVLLFFTLIVFATFFGDLDRLVFFLLIWLIAVLSFRYLLLLK